MDIKVSPIIKWSFLLLLQLTGNILHVNLCVSAYIQTGTKTETGVYLSHKSSKFKCPTDPITERYPDPSSTSCTTYFLCHLGRAYPRRCGFRLAFHPFHKGCVPRKYMPEGACTPPQECAQEGVGRTIHPEDCTHYFICYYGRQFQYACIPDYVFDTQKDQCVLDKRKAEQCVSARRFKILPSIDHPGFYQNNPNRMVQ